MPIFTIRYKLEGDMDVVADDRQSALAELDSKLGSLGLINRDNSTVMSVSEDASVDDSNEDPGTDKDPGAEGNS